MDLGKKKGYHSQFSASLVSVLCTQCSYEVLIFFFSVESYPECLNMLMTRRVQTSAYKPVLFLELLNS